ncbi:hypothetical protein DPMN_053317 [Dreissena polymorpha]|uniref:Uncharacterized protein n=1 Tax=Dreissena polymorpha TaxID=45954 RepID=A0A9D4CL51_DREPO|nr:hypothetical protein DPMN_053317 [Dreissena polymorpha]
MGLPRTVSHTLNWCPLYLSTLAMMPRRELGSESVPFDFLRDNRKVANTHQEELLLLFPEGTRWTPEKHAICQKIAKEKGYPEYKHMLLPRPKGFALSMELMQGKSILDYERLINIKLTTHLPNDTLCGSFSEQTHSQ